MTLVLLTQSICGPIGTSDVYREKFSQKMFEDKVNWVRTALNDSSVYLPHFPFFNRYVTSGVCFGTLVIQGDVPKNSQLTSESIFRERNCSKYSCLIIRVVLLAFLSNTSVRYLRVII